MLFKRLQQNYGVWGGIFVFYVGVMAVYFVFGFLVLRMVGGFIFQPGMANILV